MSLRLLCFWPFMGRTSRPFRQLGVWLRLVPFNSGAASGFFSSLR
jgi:hypothetical protein